MGRSRWKRRAAHGGLAAGALCVLFACGTGDVVIGDDTHVSPADHDGGPDGVTPDAPPGPDGSPPDAKPDALPGSCEAVGGVCQGPNTPCRKKDTTGATCAKAGDFCCATVCPTLSPPAPGFCDGGPFAPKYGVDGCIAGYGCAPLACADAGGQCVAVVPGSCASNRVGDAAKYSCGGGLGVMCCLP